MTQVCPKTQRGVTEQLYELLKSMGPMTALDLVALTGRSRQGINDSLRLLRRAKPKRIYIARYSRQPEGQSGRCMPVYAVGKLPDAREPVARSAKDRDARYRKRNRAVIRIRGNKRRGKTPSIWDGLLR